MGRLKQLHIDCTPDECVAPEEYKNTCYAGELMSDEDPTEPPESTEGSDRDPNIDMDRE